MISTPNYPTQYQSSWGNQPSLPAASNIMEWSGEAVGWNLLALCYSLLLVGWNWLLVPLPSLPFFSSLY